MKYEPVIQSEMLITNKIQTKEIEVENQKVQSSGNPVGTIIYHASSNAPDGYLVCNGAEINIETYQDLYNVIGVTYGAGSTSDTFKLPNLINQFVQGSATVGTVKAAGLPNLTGELQTQKKSFTGKLIRVDESTGIYIGLSSSASTFYTPDNTGFYSLVNNGVFVNGTAIKTNSSTTAINNVLEFGGKITYSASPKVYAHTLTQYVGSSYGSTSITSMYRLKFDASKSNTTYGKSTTVQPPALTLLPCIKY